MEILRQPINWAVVGLIATFWLLALHVVINSMMQSQKEFDNGPLPQGFSLTSDDNNPIGFNYGLNR